MFANKSKRGSGKLFSELEKEKATFLMELDATVDPNERVSNAFKREPPGLEEKSRNHELRKTQKRYLPVKDEMLNNPRVS